LGTHLGGGVHVQRVVADVVLKDDQLQGLGRVQVDHGRQLLSVDCKRSVDPFRVVLGEEGVVAASDLNRLHLHVVLGVRSPPTLGVDVVQPVDRGGEATVQRRRVVKVRGVVALPGLVVEPENGLVAGRDRLRGAIAHQGGGDHRLVYGAHLSVSDLGRTDLAVGDLGG
jgi:hypothetical protein